jgi:hypothetical protein
VNLAANVTDYVMPVRTVAGSKRPLSAAILRAVALMKAIFEHGWGI